MNIYRLLVWDEENMNLDPKWYFTFSTPETLEVETQEAVRSSVEIAAEIAYNRPMMAEILED